MEFSSFGERRDALGSGGPEVMDTAAECEEVNRFVLYSICTCSAAVDDTERE
jgi:hypothetical protein